MRDQITQHLDVLVVAEVARVMEYSAAYELYREHLEWGADERRTDSGGTVV